MFTIETDDIRATGETEREARKEFNRQRKALRVVHDQNRRNAAQARLIARSRAFWVLDRLLDERGIPRPWSIVPSDRNAAVRYDRSTYTVSARDVHDAYDTGAVVKRGETGNQYPSAATGGWFIDGIAGVVECASGAPLVVFADHGEDGGIVAYSCAVWGDSIALERLPAMVTMDKFRTRGDA